MGILRRWTWSVLLIVLLLDLTSGAWFSYKIQLSKVKVITVYKGEMTTSRRTAPVPQLKCVGKYCSKVNIKVLQCYNKGSDGKDIQWKCKAQMKKPYVLGAIKVLCEGYDY